MSAETILGEIQQWYAAQCDGDWEHSFGVSIGTLDNPGWCVSIDLTDTILDAKPFAEFSEGMDNADTDGSWIVCNVIDHKFGGMGDPSRLEQILHIFLAWAKSEPDWLALPETTPFDEDRLFWQRLPDGDGTQACAIAGCNRRCISLSIYCRKHHFEALRGKPCPFE